MPKSFIFAVLAFFVLTSGLCYGQEDPSSKTGDVVLTAADRLILQAIDRVNVRIDNLGRELNGRIDNVGRELNGRIDNLWITMLGGFLGVMGFIGALAFWDRRTFLKRAREGFRAEMVEDRKKIEGLMAAVKKLGEQFPQVQETLRSFGLL